MKPNQSVMIYHNPACSTSRNTLALIKNAGIEPTIILYLETPPSPQELKVLLTQMGLSARDVMRTNVDPYLEFDLKNADLSEAQLIHFMCLHPILMNRPIVVSSIGTRLCRPTSEKVLEILPSPQKGAFYKEDGTQIIDEKGNLIKTHTGT